MKDLGHKFNILLGQKIFLSTRYYDCHQNEGNRSDCSLGNVMKVSETTLINKSPCETIAENEFVTVSTKLLFIQFILAQKAFLLAHI